MLARKSVLVVRPLLDTMRDGPDRKHKWVRLPPLCRQDARAMFCRCASHPHLPAHAFKRAESGKGGLSLQHPDPGVALSQKAGAHVSLLHHNLSQIRANKTLFRERKRG